MNTVQASLVQSQVDLIKVVCEELGEVEKADELVEKLLGAQLKVLKGGKRKAVKDPNRPKKPKNAYMLFCDDVRSKVKADNPDQGMGGLSKIMGQMWKELSEKKKKPFVDAHKQAVEAQKS